ncbi:META domain protein [Rhodobacteraceae bacterium THAF1]|uniref:META domain-containing protein n=1 Tax=Palleronia sp. THAF1 TaxID=2587842 RepID=UPI000F3F1619|nr:META domain-containing protein [Palleronia sp. THAF1]QFU09605.1 META domain protein [Palleronia sp. THAF1]VDC17494.1 META domain protein [Rhodobacteraceae bacterium THAF1]
MRRLTILLLALAACGPDETVSAYAQDTSYSLDGINQEPFGARATMTFAEGRISGQGPCNSYAAPLTVPYPWFDLGPIAATKRACPDLAAETRFFATLAEMQFAEAQGNVLILSNEAGREMVFRTSP